MIRLFAWIGVVLAVVVAVDLWMPAIGPVSAKALDYSVTEAVGGSTLDDPGECRRKSRGVWRCDATDAHRSGYWRFRVHRRGRHCWDAVLTGDFGEFEPPRRKHGCVLARHQIRFWSHL